MIPAAGWNSHDEFLTEYQLNLNFRTCYQTRLHLKGEGTENLAIFDENFDIRVLPVLGILKYVLSRKNIVFSDTYIF